MLFPVVAFALFGFFGSWTGRTVGVAVAVGVPTSQYKKRKSRERELLLGFNSIRAARMKTSDGLGMYEFQRAHFKQGMKHWGGTFVFTDTELARFQDAAKQKDKELRTRSTQGAMQPDAVLAELRDRSELRRVDHSICKLLGIKQQKVS